MEKDVPFAALTFSQQEIVDVYVIENRPIKKGYEKLSMFAILKNLSFLSNFIHKLIGYFKPLL